MKRSLVKCMPVFALALSLSACGKSADTKTGGSLPPAALAAAGINTKFVSECGDVAAASTNAAFDLTQCQLSPSQLALLGNIGPFDVVADCVHLSVQIKNEAGEISGVGDIKPDGTYSVPLAIGERYGELENCPVKLEGLASGKVACDENKKLGKVDVNTTFTFSNVATDGTTASLALVANQPASGTTSTTAPSTVPNSALQPGEVHAEHDGPGPLPGIPGTGQGPIIGKGGLEKGGKGAVVVKGGAQLPIQTGKGVVVGKGGAQLPIQTSKGVVVGKGGAQFPAQTGGKGVVITKGGGQVLAKGGQLANNDHRVLASHVDSCVSFTPCGFSTNVALSCAR